MLRFLLTLGLFFVVVALTLPENPKAMIIAVATYLIGHAAGYELRAEQTRSKE